MNNDLISRDALINTKPEFMNERAVRDTKYQTTKDRIYAKAWNACNSYWLNNIDNAPTVDAIPNEEGYEMHSKGYLQGYERGKKERPQGEWINFDQESVYDNTFRDHYFYLLAVIGFGTPIKAKFHDDPLPCFTHYAMQNNVVGEYAIELEDITHWMHLPTIPRYEV